MSENMDLMKDSDPNELQKSEKKNLSPQLNKIEEGIIRATESQKVCDMVQTTGGQEKVNTGLSAWLQKAAIIAGFKKYSQSTPEDQTLIIKHIRDAVLKHKWIRNKELNIIFERGLQGDFDDENNKSFELNARTVSRWIKTYHDEYRRQAVRKQREHEIKLEQEQIRRESDQKYQEAWERNRKKIIDQYYQLQEDLSDKIAAGQVSHSDIPENMNELNMWYDFFNKKEYIPLTMKEKQEIFNKTLENTRKKRMDDDNMHRQRVKSRCKMYSFKILVAMLLNNCEPIEKYIDN